MFIAALIIGIALGYIFRGNLKNINFSKIKCIYLIFLAFIIKALILIALRKGILVVGKVTFFIDLFDYTLIFIFTLFNKSNKWIVVMGIGFLLNGFVIFLNGGAMPVDGAALSRLGYQGKITDEGLYVLLSSKTRLAFLGDIIPLKYPQHSVASIGDFVAAFGMAVFIITEMKVKNIRNNLNV